MNAKFLTLALGGLLLSSSAVSFADEHWGEHRDGAAAYRWSHDGDGFRDSRPYWHEHGHPRFNAGPRWCPPQPHGRWAPVPEWRPYHHSEYQGHSGGGGAYDRDGVTIIFRGHLN
jgi:hypothetical protein